MTGNVNGVDDFLSIHGECNKHYNIHVACNMDTRYLSYALNKYRTKRAQSWLFVVDIRNCSF